MRTYIVDFTYTQPRYIIAERDENWRDAEHQVRKAKLGKGDLSVVSVKSDEMKKRKASAHADALKELATSEGKRPKKHNKKNR